MEIKTSNIFHQIPPEVAEKEIFQTLLHQENVRIERICSAGQTSPEGFWYCQKENEWVILLQGEAEIEFDEGKKIRLMAGDYLFLPSGLKHRVSYTSAQPLCIWLAFYWI